MTKSPRMIWISISLSLVFGLMSSKAQNLPKEIHFSERKVIPCYHLRKMSNTILFQGNRKTKEYFEGWYFKMVSEDGSSILSVIPGISLSDDGQDQHAFIQIIDGKTAQTRYYSFPIEDFSFSKKKFALKIGANYFSEEMIILHLKDSSSFISGKIEMYNPVKYRSNRILNPGIMGWYRFIPFMQCYHGVVSLTHPLKGALTIDNKTHHFDYGKGYIEKDWGSSMPSSWIWMQSNHFSDTGSSLMLSIADIPWLGNTFTGFLGFFYHDGEIHHFATYRSTKLEMEFLDSSTVNIELRNKRNTFILQARSNNAGLLKAPVEGSMDRRIPESIDANLKIIMLDKKGQVVLTDSTHITGLEMVGDYMALPEKLKPVKRKRNRL